MAKRTSDTQDLTPRTPRIWRRVTGTVLLAVAAGCAFPDGDAVPGAATEAERPYLLERVGDAAVVQLYADGFEALPLKDQTLIWHLYQAALAGRDIYYDQRYAHGLEMREVIEATLRHGAAIDPATRQALERYAKLFWINSGPYNNLTARKFVLETTPEAFATAVTSASAAGAAYPLRDGESIAQMLARLRPMFFDASFEPSVTTKAPPDGQDILLASHNNLYDGVSTADLARFSERYPLNSRLVKRDGKLVEEVYRVGGRYDAHIRLIVGHLEAAIPHATEPMAKALRALIQWYRTGEAGDRRAYDIAWVQDTASPVDTINGFTEVYLDARGVKGAWEALVFYVNPQKTADIQKLAADAQWFEDRMPWDAKYRKAGVKGITANAIDVVVETGDSGPVTPIGINLPNDQDVRERFGSKSVSLANVNEAYDKSADPGFRREFTWSEEEATRSATWGALAGELTTNMHEVIGHASGQISPHLDGRPELALKEYYSALEEGRADLVGLYFIADPKLAEIGLVSAADQAAIVQTEYEGYTRNAIVQLRRLRDATTIEEDHMRNRQMIVHWLMANTKAIERRTRDGKTYFVMVDAAAFREGIGRLLAEVQRIKSEGDYAAARALFDEHGVRVDTALRDEVLRRVDALNLPSYSGFVMPELEAIEGANGVITQVKISYPRDLAAQMLRFSDATREARAAFLASERTRTSPGGR